MHLSPHFPRMSHSTSWRVLRSAAAIDAIIAAAVATVAYIVAHRFLAGFSVVPWIEDLLVPCTGRPGWVPDPAVLQALAQWQDLINRRIDYFPCADIAGIPLVEVGASWRQSEYFHRLLGLWFQFRGPALNGFVEFQAAFHAATCAIAFLVFRLGLWRILALGATAGLIWSPSHLTAVAMPIEYVKAPWLLASVGLCALLLRRDDQGRSLWTPALALGMVIGIGTGFKSDLLAAIPLALLTTVVFVRRTSVGPSRKAVATLCVIAGVALGGGVVLWRMFAPGQGSVLPVQFLGGMAWTTEATYVAQPLYNYGLLFDDSHITVLINSYAARALDLAGPMHFYSDQMQQASAALLRDLWTMFPGDLILRVIAANLRVMSLNGYGLAIATAGLFAIFVKDLRIGWVVSVAVVYLSAYVSLVFQRRHFYHLEFISWGLSAALIQALSMPNRWLRQVQDTNQRSHAITKPVLAAAGSLLLIAGVSMFALTAARTYQRASMLHLIEGLIQAPRDEGRVSLARTREGETLMQIDDISASAAEPAWPSDRMQSDYAAIDFSCRDAEPITIAAAYRPPAGAWDRTHSLPCQAAGTTSTLMLPIYQYGATYRFDGLVMSSQARDALRSVSVVRPDKHLPLWLPISLPADWQARPWFATMRKPIETP